MRRLLILGAVATLCGCAADGRNEMLVSKATLKACLAQHAQDVKACDAASIAFQADLASYQPMMARASGESPLTDMRAPLVEPQPSDFYSFAAR